MQFKKIFAACAFAGVAFGANNSTLTTATPSVSKGCSFKDFTATASSQVQSVAACATAVGDVTIQGDSFGSIELTGVEQFYGKLTIQNATKAETLNAPSLQLVSGDLVITANTVLSTLNLAQLTTVGTFNLNALPALEKTGLSSGITSADEIIISDTGLTSLDGINVYKLKVFNVNNNGDIESIDSGLQKVTDTLSISYNAEKVDVSLDDLTEANVVYLQSINSLSVSNLTKITGSLSLDSNSIDKIEFKGLESVGKSLSISENDDLEELDFPQLSSIGGALKVEDNEELSSFDGFPKLKTIGGSVVLSGKFDNGTFDSLNKVSGGFNLTSTGDLSCSDFTKLNKAGDIKGDKFYCRGASSTVSSSSSKKGNKNGESTSGSDSDSSDSSSSSSSSSHSSGASNTAVVKLLTVIVGFVSVGVALY
ncbi:putative GPI-anchored extracellular protein [Hyphopichia burtonii NRRL Y-1933]|uniref:Putative GPI-anchored extracellular protein n=1 Tax=Hyphopichia burtonii NRRL Y-1933 TaxID=984485 RepID=A0A1E4RDY2_9ASCO|nr:putative GPI-anchored extracellular protein [Hyphopichia burtonii NRRL Y-1933]ODV65474.1 putative GPI-anchored extracellular protein [Hyphopichia burtonii NRRL Y-1933]